MALLPFAITKRDREAEGSASGLLSLSAVGALAGAVSVLAGVALAAKLNHPAPLVGGLLAGLYMVFAIRVADQWEKAVVLRLGKFGG